MRFLCIFLPPVAVWMRGTPIEAVLNFFLTLLLWLPGVIHAWIVVSRSNEEQRTQRANELVVQRQQEAEWEAAHTSDTPPAPPPGYIVPPEPPTNPPSPPTSAP